MARTKKTPFPPWQTRTSDGIEKRYIRLGNTLLYAPAFLQLSAKAKETYIYMLIESAGQREFTLPHSKYSQFSKKDSFIRSSKELEKAGFIEVQHNGNLRKANVYRFSDRWKERYYFIWLSVFATHILYIAIYTLLKTLQEGNSMEWDNESIVKQIQSEEGNQEEFLKKLWTDNLGLVRKIIHRLTGLQYGYPPDKEDFEDLEQQAFIGIMDSIRHYDSTKGEKFFTFAYYYIKLSVYRYYDFSGQLLRIPYYMRKRIRDFIGERDRLREKGLPATDEMIQERIGLTDKSLLETLRAIQKLELQRLDSYLNESDKESGTVLDMIASNENTSDTALASSYDTDLKALLRSVLQELSKTERQVLTARHFQRMNIRHIANLMKCTPQNVSKIAKTTYKRIRTGKYGKELATFLPERASHRAEKRIQDEFKELSAQERDLLI